jgi:hypothetical protein
MTYQYMLPYTTRKDLNSNWCDEGVGPCDHISFPDKRLVWRNKPEVFQTMTYQYKYNEKWYDETTGPDNFVTLPDWLKAKIVAGPPIAMAEVGFKNLKWRAKPTTVWQYYYSTSKVQEECWHDEGTAPWPDLKYNALKVDKTGRSTEPWYATASTIYFYWREKPAPSVVEDVQEKPVSEAFPTTGNTIDPVKGDADENGFLQVLTDQGWELFHWTQVKDLVHKFPWRHTLLWKGPGTDEEVLENARHALSDLNRMACVPTPTNTSDLDLIEIALERFQNKL